MQLPQSPSQIPKPNKGSWSKQILVEMVNARELGAWVNKDEQEGATERIKDEVKGIVNKVKGLSPLPVYTREVRQRGLVLGGGLAGLNAALSISSQGIPVDIIEKGL